MQKISNDFHSWHYAEFNWIKMKFNKTLSKQQEIVFFSELPFIKMRNRKIKSRLWSNPNKTLSKVNKNKWFLYANKCEQPIAVMFWLWNVRCWCRLKIKVAFTIELRLCEVMSRFDEICSAGILYFCSGFHFTLFAGVDNNWNCCVHFSFGWFCLISILWKQMHKQEVELKWRNLHHHRTSDIWHISASRERSSYWTNTKTLDTKAHKLK